MLGRILVTTLVALACLSPVSSAQDVPPHSARTPIDAPRQDFSRSVVPITSVKFFGFFVQAKFGTGFCLDPGCQFIGTNYHVAAMMKHVRIKGAKVVRRYLATGPNDQGATLNYMASRRKPLRYMLSRDLAIFRLSKPLRSYHGLQFSTQEPNRGQQVDIYTYPKKGVINPFRSLQKFHGTFQGDNFNGLMVIEYAPNDGQRVRPGASGGIVVDDANGKVVGILNEIARNKKPIALAVPVENLAAFLNRAQPFLAALLFPIKTVASPDEEDFYPKYRLKRSSRPQRRTAQSDESDAVRLLRERAQSLVDGMRYFIAVQTYAWGKGTNRVEAADAYEVQVRDGVQRFREYRDGKKWRREPTPPGDMNSVTPSRAWSALPWYIGTKVGVKIREAPQVIFHGHRIRVFQYYGSVEDEPCSSTDITEFLFFSIHRYVQGAPYGEVWTDQQENILRMSLHCEDHGWGWGNTETIVTYGWLTKPGVGSRLVPVTIVYKALWKKKKLYWCRGQFVHYREFVSRARLLSAVGPQ